MNESESAPGGAFNGDEPGAPHSRDLILRLVTESPFSMSWIYSPDEGRYLFCSEAAYTLYGRTCEEMRSLGISGVLTSEAARRVMQEVHLVVQELHSGGQHEKRTGYFRFDEFRHDGSVFQTEAMVASDPGAASVLVVGMTRDVTGERKKLRVIRESDSLLKFIAENAGDILWTYDFELDRYTYASPSVFTLRGFTPDEVLQQRLLDALTPESAEKAQKLVSERIEALKNGDLSAKCGVDEFEQVRKDGSSFMTEVMTTFVIDDRGQVSGIVGIARDISERIAKEVRQKELEKKLYETQKNESIGRIAGGVAHELNNALTPIVGYTEILGKKLKEVHGLSGYVELISRSAQRATDLIDQLLDFTRAQVLDLRFIDLNHAVLNFERLLRSSIREDIAILIRHDGSSPRVRIDLQKFRQIILNLALNAQDAMPAGGSLSVDIGTVSVDEAEAMDIGMAAGRYARLVVADHGEGIPPSILPNIFEPFFTTKQAALASGLGLSSVYGIVSQHGGHIMVDSQVGAGTIVSIRLPLFVQDETLAGQQGIADGSERADRYTILLAEDDDMVRGLVSEVLGQHGYRLIVAEDADTCIRKARDHDGPVDLLVTDIIMPGMNGAQLAAEIGALYPAISVLFMTGYDQHTITGSIPLPERHSFIRKPFFTKELSALVSELLMPGGG